MWLAAAILSSVFAGFTAILAKCGIKKTGSDIATAIRTVVVLVFSWLMVFLVGSQGQIGQISRKALFFLILSGLSTGASWLCYFRALQLGDVNKVAPIDKSSTVLTIILAFLLFGEPISVPKIIGILGIGIGTLLMIVKKETDKNQVQSRSWLLYGRTVIFASCIQCLSTFCMLFFQNAYIHILHFYTFCCFGPDSLFSACAAQNKYSVS